MVGMEAFSARAYEDVWVEEIAERAGISRGLLYHYFPSKRDFYVAVTRAAAEEARALTEPDPTLDSRARLHTGIGAFLAYAESRSQGFLTAYRGSLVGDPEVRAIIEDGRRQQAERILSVVAGTSKPPKVLHLAVRGWIAFAQDVTAEWLQARRPSRKTVTDLLFHALLGAIGAAAETDPQVATVLLDRSLSSGSGHQGRVGQA